MSNVDNVATMAALFDRFAPKSRDRAVGRTIHRPRCSPGTIEPGRLNIECLGDARSQTELRLAGEWSCKRYGFLDLAKTRCYFRKTEQTPN